MAWGRSLMIPGKKQLLANLLDYSGLNRMLSCCSSWSGLLVLNYHRIGDPNLTAYDRNLFSATAEMLERQIVQFQSHADLVSIADLDDVFARRRGKAILLTFDDGYRDNYDLAFPVLQDCRAKATFFIATGFIDQPRIAWWDELAWMIRRANVAELPVGQWLKQAIPLSSDDRTAAIGQVVRRYWELPAAEGDAFLNELAAQTGVGRHPLDHAAEQWMTWDMIRELAAAGHDIGGHTVNHPVLAQCTPEEQQFEIFTSRARLTEQLGTAPTAFSYPVGQRHMFTAETERLLEAAGYRWGFSFYGQYAGSPGINRFDLPRCAVDFAQPASLFRSRLVLPQLFARK